MKLYVRFLENLESKDSLNLADSRIFFGSTSMFRTLLNIYDEASCLLDIGFNR